MPSYTYKDRPERKFFVEPGEYIIRISGYEAGFSKNGNEKLDLKLEVKTEGVHLKDTLTFTEQCEWKIDVFLKALGIKPSMGERIDFSDEFCRKLIGKEAWVLLELQEYPVGSGKKYNKVVQWITTKPLPTNAF